MNISRKAMLFVVFVCLAAFLLQGCAFLDKITGKTPAENGTVSGTAETDPAEPAEEVWVKVTCPADNATGVDTKLPVKWWVDEEAGKVTTLGVNIFECGPDGRVPPGASAVAIYKMTYDKAPELREWTFFEKDVNKYWMFTGSHEGMKELKPNTKYMMNFVISTDAGKSRTIPVYFTTK